MRPTNERRLALVRSCAADAPLGRAVVAIRLVCCWEIEQKMRDLRELDEYRIDDFTGDDRIYNGVFIVISKTTRRHMRVIASNDEGWDHVSISLNYRCPNWHEMEQIKRMFFKDDETCWQYHVPPSDHINIHPHVLHIWRKHDFEIPMPPRVMI